MLEWFEGRDQGPRPRPRAGEVRARRRARARGDDLDDRRGGRPPGRIRPALRAASGGPPSSTSTTGGGSGRSICSSASPSCYGSGLGRAVVQATAEYLVAERAARQVVIMPYSENARAVAAYRAAGFVGDHDRARARDARGADARRAAHGLPAGLTRCGDSPGAEIAPVRRSTVRSIVDAGDVQRTANSWSASRAVRSRPRMPGSAARQRARRAGRARPADRARRRSRRRCSDGG